jgi:hypothetical protein
MPQIDWNPELNQKLNIVAHEVHRRDRRSEARRMAEMEAKREGLAESLATLKNLFDKKHATYLTLVAIAEPNAMQRKLTQSIKSELEFMAFKFNRMLSDGEKVFGPSKTYKTLSV